MAKIGEKIGEVPPPQTPETSVFAIGRGSCRSPGSADGGGPGMVFFPEMTPFATHKLLTLRRFLTSTSNQ
jgi:hypothetical protein